MKKSLLLKAIALLAFFTCAMGASADRINFDRDGICYLLTTYDDGTGAITVDNGGSYNIYSGIVNIPDTVYYEGAYYPVVGIGYQAFKDCTGLTAVTIPEGVTMLLNESFAGCTSLTNITLPSTLTSIYNNAFVGCSNLSTITCMNPDPRSFSSNNFDASTYANATLMVPLGSKSSYQNTSAWSQFSNIQETNKFVVDGIYYTVTSGNNVSVTYRDENYCSYDGEVIIPSTVTYGGTTYNVTGVGQSAFRGCYVMGNLFITVPNSVTTIGTYAFYDSKISYLEIGTGVTSIGDYAFRGATEDNLHILFCRRQNPPTVAANTFGSGNFENTNLWVSRMALARYKSARYWSDFNEDNLFYGYDFIVDGIYYGINPYSNTVEVSAYALAVDSTKLFSAYGEQENIVIPPTVTYEGVEYVVNEIGCAAHYNWKTKSVTLPSTIKKISAYAYRNCSNLEQISFSGGVTEIGMMAFLYCESLQRIDIPSSVKSIGYAAFYGCSSLQQAGIGACVEQIDDLAFVQCPNLTTILSYPLFPPVITNDVFDDNAYSDATLYAPVSSLPDYQVAEGWKNFYNIVGMHTLDEALNAPGSNIHFEESDYPWVVLNAGGRLYAQSGNAGVHSSSSTLSTTVKVTVPSILSFDFKAWGESIGLTDYDECVFMANGTSIFRYGARDNDWETFTFELTPDVTYNLKWFYHKDVSDNGSGDYFALDNMQIKPKVQRGDVNGDGSINVADVTALIQIVLNSQTIDLAIADLDNSGTINVADVTALIQMVLNN